MGKELNISKLGKLLFFCSQSKERNGEERSHQPNGLSHSQEKSDLQRHPRKNDREFSQQQKCQQTSTLESQYEDSSPKTQKNKFRKLQTLRQIIKSEHFSNSLSGSEINSNLDIFSDGADQELYLYKSPLAIAEKLFFYEARDEPIFLQEIKALSLHSYLDERRGNLFSCQFCDKMLPRTALGGHTSKKHPGLSQKYAQRVWNK